MKPLALIFFSLFLSLNFLYSQSPDFTILLNEDMNYSVDMIQTYDGNFIIAGNNQSRTNVFVTSVNTQGQIVWSNYFSGEMLWYSRIAQKSNGNILIPLGNSIPVLIELSSQGDSVGSLSISEAKRSFFATAIETSDSLLFVSELVFNNDPFFPAIDSSYLVKISNNGNIIDRYLLDYIDIKDVLLNSDENLFLLVTADSSINSFIAEYNINGEILSVSSCNSNNLYPFRLFELNESAYFSNGYFFNEASMNASLVGFDIDNQIEFCSLYDDSYFSSITNSLTNDNIYILGDNNGVCFIKTADYGGNILNDFQLSDSLDGSTIASDNGYLYVSGTNNYLSDPRACFVKIHQDSLLLGKSNMKQMELKVYPNPTSNNIFIQNPDNIKIIKIELADLTGKKVKEFKGNLNVLNIQDIKSGIYFYVIHTFEFVSNGKILINN